jgi:hypothetical protein
MALINLKSTAQARAKPAQHYTYVPPKPMVEER